MAELPESDKKIIMGDNYRSPEERRNDPVQPDTLLVKLWRWGKNLITRQR